MSVQSEGVSGFVQAFLCVCARHPAVSQRVRPLIWVCAREREREMKLQGGVQGWAELRKTSLYSTMIVLFG